MLPLIVVTAMAFQPAPLLTHRGIVAHRPKPRTSDPQAVLPAAVKYAVVGLFLAGPTVQLGYAIEVSAGIEGPFYRFVKSDAVQKGGGKIRSMKDVPKVNIRSVRLPAAAEEVAQTFKKDYPKKTLEQVYGALLSCYGNEDRALAAIQLNPQILNPSYSPAPKIVESKRVLLTLMSEEDAQEVMRMNPAVLQCGPSLDALGVEEIKAIARARNFAERLVPPQIRTAVVGAGVASILLVIASQQLPNADPLLLEAVDRLRPVLGVGGASLFAFVLYGVSTTGRKVDQTKKKKR